MAKTKRARRSAIVPRLLLSASIMSGAAVIPTLAGCGGSGETFSVACQFCTVAAEGFDLSTTDQNIVFTVAAQGFDLANADAENPDAG
jgi:hypothetical protein